MKHTLKYGNTRVRSWILVVNNWTDDDWNRVLDLEEMTRPKIEYAIIGQEVGEKGTPHLQGYIRFANANTWINTLVKWWPRGHFEPAKGNDQQNQKYCSKDGTFFEKGTPSGGKGTRTDLKRVHKKVIDKEIKNEREFFESEDITITQQSLQLCRSALRIFGAKRRLTKPPEVNYFFGESGSGKTTSVYNIVDGLDTPYFVANSNGKWWDGYDGQSIVIIDDWRPTWLPYQDLLRLLDRFEFQGEIKGGHVHVVACAFYITSPLDPVTCWVGREDPKQLCRRITLLRRYIGEQEFNANQAGEDEPETWDPLDPSFEIIDAMTFYKENYVPDADERSIY